MDDRCIALLSVRPGDRCRFHAKHGFYCGVHERIYLRTNAMEATLRLREMEETLQRHEETLAQIQDMQITTAVQVRKIRRDTKGRTWRDKLGGRRNIDPKESTWIREVEYINGTKERRET